MNRERLVSDADNILALIDSASIYSSENEEIVKEKLKEAVLYVNPNTTPYEKKELGKQML